MSKHTPGPWKVERNHNNKLMGISADEMAHDLDFVVVFDFSGGANDIEANA